MEKRPFANKTYEEAGKPKVNSEQELARVIAKLEEPDATESDTLLKTFLIDVRTIDVRIREGTRMQTLFQALNKEGLSWHAFLALDPKEAGRVAESLANFVDPNLTKEAIIEKANQVVSILKQSQ